MVKYSTSNTTIEVRFFSGDKRKSFHRQDKVFAKYWVFNSWAFESSLFRLNKFANANPNANANLFIYLDYLPIILWCFLDKTSC